MLFLNLVSGMSAGCTETIFTRLNVAIKTKYDYTMRKFTGLAVLHKKLVKNMVTSVACLRKKNIQLQLVYSFNLKTPQNVTTLTSYCIVKYITPQLKHT